ncbi:MAG: type 2 lantipeptide synthetase LanM [Rhodospirillales bacterium]|nr:type 2 lantipeptide synthetase LanM [Acetobacter sp.]
MDQVRCLSSADLDQIICRSSNLAERLAGGLTPVGENPRAAERLVRWKFLVANHDETVFRRRLEADGIHDISETRLLALLGDVQRPVSASVPSWADLLPAMSQAVSAAFLSRDAHSAPLFCANPRTIPFAGLYSPITTLAQRKLEAIAPTLTAHLGAQAWQGLRHHLCSRLSSVCSLALQTMFLAFKAIRQPGITFPFGKATSQPRVPRTSESIYKAFVQEQGAQGLCAFFIGYPVAARLAAQAVQQWMEFVTEFLGRLDTDYSTVSAHFAGRMPLGRIEKLKAGLSDPHRGGRSVLILQFENQLRLVYKPRSMQIDAAFSGLLEWFNVRSRSPALLRLDVLAREGYGWENYIGCSPCTGRAATKRFYRRAGALLCLIHASRGTDVHCENLIAAADHPVVVDLEALCHPQLYGSSLTNEADREEWRLINSVLRTGLLPIWEKGVADERSYNFSAFGAPVHQRPAIGAVCWRKINTDAMEAFWGTSPYTCVTHRPRWQGKPQSAAHYLDELVGGFRGAAHLIAPRGKLSAEWRTWMETLDRLDARIIRRPTLIYMTLLHFSLQPYFLSAGIDRSIELQALSSAPEESAQRAAELAALEQLDVPYFSNPPGQNRATSAGPHPVEGNDWMDPAAQVAIIKAALKGQITSERGRLRHEHGTRMQSTRTK